MKRSLDQLIQVEPDICHGQPCFAGTRVLVSDILELLEAGVTPAVITSKKYFPRLTHNHVRAALHFAAEYAKHQEYLPLERPAQTGR